MDFQEVVRRRRMVRNFDPERPVDGSVRERILENALRGPSAGNSQGFEFLVCETADERERFWKGDVIGSGVRTPTISLAPGFVGRRSSSCRSRAETPISTVTPSPTRAGTDRDESRWPVPDWHIDAGMAALLMLLTSVDAGLGACLFGITPEQIPPFRAAFGVPDSLTPIGAVAIGHGAPDAPSPSLKRGRRAVGDAVHRGSY